MRGDCAAEINLKINAFDYSLNSVSKPPLSGRNYFTFIYLDDPGVCHHLLLFNWPLLEN